MVDISHTEIYDSGCSKHLTSYKKDLENFVKINPKSFCTVNKQSMSAVGKGKLVIDVPNSSDPSKLYLTEVFYSPEAGYMLISIGKLNKKGFTATFSDGKCVIHGPEGGQVGSVPCQSGLYCVTHDVPEAARAVNDLVTLDQLHC